MEQVNLVTQTFTVTGDAWGNIVIPLDPCDNGDVVSAEFVGAKPTSVSGGQIGYDYANRYFVISVVQPISTTWTIKLTWIKTKFTLG